MVVVGSILQSNLFFVFQQSFADWDSLPLDFCYFHTSKEACGFLHCDQYFHIFASQEPIVEGLGLRV